MTQHGGREKREADKRGKRIELHRVKDSGEARECDGWLNETAKEMERKSNVGGRNVDQANIEASYESHCFQIRDRSAKPGKDTQATGIQAREAECFFRF